MLLLQKAFVEGALSLVVECLKWYDLEKLQHGDEKERARIILELLTPIVKTYPSEYGIVSTSNALQVFGGYGFTMDFVAQQYYRDIRIMSIYEGTTGIQSMDLLGRKIPMKQGQAIHVLMEEMMKASDTAASFPALNKYVQQFREAVNRMGLVLSHLQKHAASGNIELYMSDANLFMEFAGITVVAWQWLKQGIVAQQKMAEGPGDFYYSKMETLKFYFKYELPKTLALAASLMSDDVVTIKGDREILI
jgi:hypothetical protein